MSSYTIGLILGLRFLPPVIFIPFYYIVLSKLNLINTLFGLICVYTFAFTIVAATCLVPSFLALKKAHVSQALLEGASTWQICCRIILPQVQSGLIVSWCFAFMSCWNELLLVSFLTETPKAQGISVYCFSSIGQFRIDFQGLCMGGALSLLPCLLGVISFSWFLSRLSKVEAK
ncbi:ABC transporter permease subunit [Ereboglobus sp. PH5-10]|uniref:ABC transporter permease subunit n=1 Tax=Ereboglobus sp. PH5-10 TaxID=2940629 RepID=UPI002406E3A2|nr:ABC transporter permease subunit [Ereboglobus sp. PH5-10]